MIALDQTATAAISGVTITRGVVPNVGTFIGGGGGILNHGTLTLADVVITRNTGGPGGGGGIFNAGTLTVVDSTIAGNDSVHEGGGINNEHIASMGRVSTGTLTVIDSTIAQNVASHGGGIINANSIVTITGSTLSGNTASGSGGGGGGIFNFAAGTVHLVNSTLTGNDAFNGGAINNGSSCVAFSCLVTLNNVTIAGNSAEVGGGITNQGDQTVTIANTILAGNTVRSGSGPDCLNGSDAAALISGGYNIIGNPQFCVVLGDTTGNQVGGRRAGFGLTQSEQVVEEYLIPSPSVLSRRRPSINRCAPRYAAKGRRLLGVNGSTSAEKDPKIPFVPSRPRFPRGRIEGLPRRKSTVSEGEERLLATSEYYGTKSSTSCAKPTAR